MWNFIKLVLLLGFIACLGVFIYWKIQINGNPNSSFNQTTRYSLGKHPWTRTVLGLHSAGDARAEYFLGAGPIAIEWFKPQTEDLDQNILTEFSDLVKNYTGRQTQVIYGGAINDGVVPLANLAVFKLKASSQLAGGATPLVVFFTQDYSPRPSNELSTTYGELGMAISLSGHKQFLSSRGQDLDKYLLSSMLHEFGHQIGLEHNQDPNCVMNAHVGISEQPLEVFGRREPQDFCQSEQKQINNIKFNLQNN